MPKALHDLDDCHSEIVARVKVKEVQAATADQCRNVRDAGAAQAQELRLTLQNGIVRHFVGSRLAPAFHEWAVQSARLGLDGLARGNDNGVQIGRQGQVYGGSVLVPPQLSELGFCVPEHAGLKVQARQRRVGRSRRFQPAGFLQPDIVGALEAADSPQGRQVGRADVAATLLALFVCDGHQIVLVAAPAPGT